MSSKLRKQTAKLIAALGLSSSEDTKGGGFTPAVAPAFTSASDQHNDPIELNLGATAENTTGISLLLSHIFFGNTPFAPLEVLLPVRLDNFNRPPSRWHSPGHLSKNYPSIQPIAWNGSEERQNSYCLTDHTLASRY